MTRKTAQRRLTALRDIECIQPTSGPRCAWWRARAKRSATTLDHPGSADCACASTTGRPGRRLAAVKKTTHGRWAFALTSASVAWALALVPAAFILPVYGTVTFRAGPNGAHVSAVQHGSATLVAVNGASPRLLILVAIPAALAAIAWIGLHRLCTRGRMSGRRIATSAIAVLFVLTLLTGFSIGAEMLPVLALLVIGRALTPAGTPQQGLV